MKQIIAFVVILIVVFGSFTLHGGRLGTLFKISEVVIIFGSAIASLFMASKGSTIKLMFKQIKKTFGKSAHNRQFYNNLLSLMYELVNIAKTQNVKSLDMHVENPTESTIFSKYPDVMADELTMNFIVDSFRQVISSKLPAHELEAMLDEEISILSEEYLKPSQKLNTMAEATPGIGILAAVMGIILTMENLDGDVGLIGKNIASALVGTFTGIFGCYCIFGPMSGAIHDIAEEQMEPLHCVKSVILGYCQGLSAHLCANAGRKNIESSHKPSFIELEDLIADLRGASNDDQQQAA